MTPNTIQFHDINSTWVMRITADRRIEVNDDVEVTDAAKKVLEAMQSLLDAQRQWVGLTQEQIESCYGGEIDDFARAIEAKSKELNT